MWFYLERSRPPECGVYKVWKSPAQHDGRSARVGGLACGDLDIVTSTLEILFAAQPYVTSSVISDLVVGDNKLKWEDIITNLAKQVKKSRPQFDK